MASIAQITLLTCNLRDIFGSDLDDIVAFIVLKTRQIGKSRSKPIDWASTNAYDFMVQLLSNIKEHFTDKSVDDWVWLPPTDVIPQISQIIDTLFSKFDFG